MKIETSFSLENTIFVMDMKNENCKYLHPLSPTHDPLGLRSFLHSFISSLSQNDAHNIDDP